eukprot:scaffold104900_cov31-Tisochrysis_lutea.AAC.1
MAGLRLMQPIMRNDEFKKFTSRKELSDQVDVTRCFRIWISRVTRLMSPEGEMGETCHHRKKSVLSTCFEVTEGNVLHDTGLMMIRCRNTISCVVLRGSLISNRPCQPSDCDPHPCRQCGLSPAL